jgi:ABC-type bacteriocin/lantibiotic exporter with double-glycine peptidase domain
MKKLLFNNLYVNAIRNIRELLTLEEKKRGAFMIMLLLFNALSDVFGLLGILPVFAVATDFSIVSENAYLAAFYSMVGSPSEFQFLLILSFLLLIIFIIKNGISLYIQYIQSLYAFDISLSLSKKQFQYNYKQGYAFIRNEDSGSLIYKISGIPLQFAKFYIMPTFNLTTELVVLFFIFIGLFIYNPMLLILVILAMMPGFSLIYYLTKRRVKEAGDRRDKLYPLSVLRILEGMNGFTDVKLSNKEQIALDDYGDIRAEINKIDALVEGLYNKVHQRSNEVILALGIIGIFAFGALFPDSRTNIIFIMGAFGAAALRVMPSFNRIITSMLSLKNFSFTVDRMSPLKNQYIVEYPIHPKMDFEDKMEIKNLSFSYPNTNAPTLRDINISVKKGEMVGIIGASGSGKTTLLNLVLQFLESGDGQIKIDNQILNKDNSGSFQKILGYVKQDVFIKDAPMMENIAFDRHNIDKKRVLRVIEESHLSDFLAELPDGLNTMLGENGANLSGGQKQRIGIARALYQDAEILLFDEITSALDAETEQAITESISNLAKLNKTVIIVAHRISTLRYCDRIYELKDGEIIREVSYAELTV